MSQALRDAPDLRSGPASAAPRHSEFPARAFPLPDRRQLALAALRAWETALVLGLLGGFAAPRAFGAGAAPAGSGWRFALWLGSSALAVRAAFSAADLYRSRRLERGAGEARDVACAVTAALALAAASGALLGLPALSPAALAAVWLGAGAAALGSRRALRAGLAALRRRGRNLRQVVIVGGGPRARRRLDELSRPELGYRVLGYVDERRPGAGLRGVPHLGRPQDIDAILAAHVVDEVVVALPIRSCYDPIARVIRSCERQGIPLSLPLDLFDRGLGRRADSGAHEPPLLRYAWHRVNGWPGALKRALDVALSALLLCGLAPLFGALALLVRLSSPGPVFFVQPRVGLHKRVFNLIKFRTMVPDAERRLAQVLHLNEADGPVFKLRDDPRITAVGRWLRKLSLDELPQLLNVLRGEMSLVGPRPLPLRDVSGFSEHGLRRRFSVKPGITCFWQVSGRSDVGFRAWMELDLRYIEHWSLALDLWLLLRTLPAVLRGTGAR